jgi:hypothetical protein
MSRKSTIMALAAIASLATFALASTDASARGGGGGGGGMRMGGGGGHMSSFRTSGIRTGGLRGSSFAFRRIVRIHPPHWHPHYRFGWRRPYWIAPVVATGVAAYAAPTWNRCTCLTKEYTPEGAVVFKDLCTKEIAMNPPEVPAPAAELPPQQPQTQGYAQPQPYPQYR